MKNWNFFPRSLYSTHIKTSFSYPKSSTGFLDPIYNRRLNSDAYHFLSLWATVSARYSLAQAESPQVPVGWFNGHSHMCSEWRASKRALQRSNHSERAAHAWAVLLYKSSHTTRLLPDTPSSGQALTFPPDLRAYMSIQLLTLEQLTAQEALSASKQRHHLDSGVLVTQLTCSCLVVRRRGRRYRRTKRPECIWEDIVYIDTCWLTGGID